MNNPHNKVLGTSKMLSFLVKLFMGFAFIMTGLQQIDVKKRSNAKKEKLPKMKKMEKTAKKKKKHKKEKTQKRKDSEKKDAEKK